MLVSFGLQNEIKAQCNDDLSWLDELIATDSSIQNVSTYTSPSLGITIVYLDVDNALDAPDIYTDCEGNPICTQGGIFPSTCDESFLEELIFTQEIYVAEPTVPCSEFEAGITILSEPSCGDENGVVSIFTNSDTFYAYWYFDGSGELERSDLAEGIYDILVSNSDGCTTVISVILTSDCPPISLCEGDFQWVEDMVETDSSIVNISEYFAPALGNGGYNIIVVDYFNENDGFYTIYNCFGDVICINGETEGGNCENIIMETAELLQVLYQGNPVDDCQNFWVDFVVYETACGSANGEIQLFSNNVMNVTVFDYTGDIIATFAGEAEVIINNLAAGYYIVEMSNNIGCTFAFDIEVFEECPPPPSCESDLSWAIEIAESDDCICRVEEYFSYVLGINVIFIDSDCNDVDMPDTYFDCEGNWLCSTNGEIPDEDFCEFTFTDNLQYVQNVYYACNPNTNDCNDEWIYDFWYFADHIYCNAVQYSDAEGSFFYGLSGYNANGDFVSDMYDCYGNYLCQLNSDVPEEVYCNDFVASLEAMFDIFDDCGNSSGNLLVANDDYAPAATDTVIINVLANDIFPVSNATLEQTEWQLLGWTGGIAGITETIDYDFSMILDGGIIETDFAGDLVYYLSDGNIIQLDIAFLEAIGDYPVLGNNFFYYIENNRLYLYNADVSDGYSLEFIANPALEVSILSEPTQGTAFVNANSTITYLFEGDSEIYEDFFVYQICSEINNEIVCDTAQVVLFPDIIDPCDAIEVCELGYCLNPDESLEICFEECGFNLDGETIFTNMQLDVAGQIDIIGEPCIMYTPPADFQGVEFFFIAGENANTCFEAYVIIEVFEGCEENPCNLESIITLDVTDFYGTEDIGQSSWWATFCFTDSLNFGLDNIISYDWVLESGATSTDETFCIELPVRENGENIDFTDYLACLIITDANGCTAEHCISYRNPLNSTQAQDDWAFVNENETIEVDVIFNDAWYNNIIINTGQTEPVLSIIEAPAFGTASITTEANCAGLFCDRITYTPNSGFIGLDQMAYQFCINDWCSTAVVYFEVGEIGAPAIIQGDVWPGDANADGVANNFDVLAVGLAFYSEGPERPNATVAWEAQYAPNWETETTAITLAESFDSIDINTFASYLIDNKHTDCDGNGLVAAEDIAAIELNYGLSHGKGITADQEPMPESPILSIEVQGDTLLAGSTVTADLVLKMPDGSPVENAYGLAFTINYENNVDDVPLVVEGTMQMEMIDSWMGNSYNTVKVVKDFGADQRIDIGYTRIDHQQLSGSGKIGTMSFIIEENVAGKTAAYFPLNLSIENAFIGNAAGALVPTNIENETVEVTTSGSTPPPIVLQEFKVYPNPANDLINIDLGNIEAQKSVLIDLSGRIVYQNEMLHTNTFTIESQNLASGFYLLNIQTKEGYSISKKIEIFH